MAVAAGTRPTKLGRYELITQIGQGGMAEVQLALQRGPAGFEKLVVVKLVHERLATEKAFVDMLLDEARVAALVKHPNVVDIYDLGEAQGRYFIAMEYLEGEPLLAVLRAGRDGKRLDPLSTGRLVADTAEGLDAAHELRSMSGERIELVHHDISLGNIVVLYNGQVKLVDFGVAKASQSQATRRVQGKFGYMAPEKLTGMSGDRRSDIFSLGCVFWEALTLRRLFRGGNDGETMKQVLERSIAPPSRVNPESPPDFDAIVMRSLERDPDRRHPTAKQLAVEIEEVLRKRGYGAKNDRIARYMQDTFRTHIDARKKLVQEVVSKGSASAAVISEAFSDLEIASGSPMHPPDLDVAARMQFRTPPAVPALVSESSDLSKPTMVAPPPVFEGESVVTNTEIDQRSFADMHEGNPDAAFEATVAQDPITPTPDPDPVPPPLWRDRRIQLGLGATALLLVAIVVGAIRRSAAANDDTSGAKSTMPAPAPTPAPAPPPESKPLVDEPKQAPPSQPPAASGSAAEVEIEPPKKPDVVRPHKVDKPKPVAPTEPAVDTDALFKEGVQAYVRGDTKSALAALSRVRAAKPGYAPTYRVLGQVYEKQGAGAAAKAAYQRYLQLAPRAPDAAAIRAKVEKL